MTFHISKGETSTIRILVIDESLNCHDLRNAMQFPGSSRDNSLGQIWPFLRDFFYQPPQKGPIDILGLRASKRNVPCFIILRPNNHDHLHVEITTKGSVERTIDQTAMTFVAFDSPRALAQNS